MKQFTNDVAAKASSPSRHTLISFLSSPKGIIIVLSDLYLMGVIFHLIPLTKPIIAFMTPGFLLLAGLLILFGSRLHRSRKALIWLAFVYSFTFALEVLGVSTGLIFGPYSYGPGLGWKLFGVPLVIGFNWALIVLGLASGFDRLIRGRGWPFTLLFGLAVGLSAAFFDFLMEPVAISLAYWAWSSSAIPLQNYLAWFLIAALCGISYKVLRIKVKSLLFIAYVALQTLFFLALSVSIA